MAYRTWICGICGKEYSEKGKEHTPQNGAPNWGGVMLAGFHGDLCPEHSAVLEKIILDLIKKETEVK